MTLKKINSKVLAAGALVFLALIVGFISYTQKTEAASQALAPAFKTASTTNTVTLTSSVVVLATTTPGSTRAYSTFCNPSATPVALNFDGGQVATSGNATTFIAAAAGYMACFNLIDDYMSYQGAVTASSTAGAVTISAKEYVY